MRPNPGRRFLWWTLPCLLLSFFLLAYPMLVIQPFRAQGARELAAALWVVRFRPVLMPLCLLVCLSALAAFWRNEKRTGRRVIAVAPLIAVAAATVFARVNVFEIMFHPLDGPSFSAAAESKLDPAEKVIAIQVGTSARAYTVRGMSYHHIVNDELAGEPIVATY